MFGQEFDSPHLHLMNSRQAVSGQAGFLFVYKSVSKDEVKKRRKKLFRKRILKTEISTD